jgi:hypothetical protein
MRRFDLDALYACHGEELLVFIARRTADPQLALDLWADVCPGGRGRTALPTPTVAQAPIPALEIGVNDRRQMKSATQAVMSWPKLKRRLTRLNSPLVRPSRVMTPPKR